MTTTKTSLERTGTVLVWALAGMQMVTALSGYVLPREAHVAIGKVFYGAYATEQFAVLDSHSVVSFFHRFGGFLFMALVLLQFMPRLRARHITFHRWSGRFLVATGLIFGVSALVMAGRFPYAGTREIIPMYFFGLMFLYSIVRGFLEVRREEHRVAPRMDDPCCCPCFGRSDDPRVLCCLLVHHGLEHPRRVDHVAAAWVVAQPAGRRMLDQLHAAQVSTDPRDLCSRRPCRIECVIVCAWPRLPTAFVRFRLIAYFLIQLIS
jgi:hypothetical protein